MAIVRTLLCTLLLLFAWGVGVLCFAWKLDGYALPPETQADAVVVLTGGIGRIDYGLSLLAQEKGNALFISGVHANVAEDALYAQTEPSLRYLLSSGRVTLGHRATNTIENAHESANWIAQRGYQRILLVTTDYHMPRALLEYAAALPASVKLIPAAVSSANYHQFLWLTEPELRTLILSEFHKLLAARLRHLLIAHMKASPPKDPA